MTVNLQQGITIDVAYRYFTTEKRSFIVADTPGHEEYTRNMAVGASFADLAVIYVLNIVLEKKYNIGTWVNVIISIGAALVLGNLFI